MADDIKIFRTVNNQTEADSFQFYSTILSTLYEWCIKNNLTLNINIITNKC